MPQRPSRNVQIYRPGHGFAWLTRKQADAAVGKGLATWIEDARTREMVCHFIDLRVEYKLQQSPTLTVVMGTSHDSGTDHPWAYWPTGDYEFST